MPATCRPSSSHDSANQQKPTGCEACTHMKEMKDMKMKAMDGFCAFHGMAFLPTFISCCLLMVVFRFETMCCFFYARPS